MNTQKISCEVQNILSESEYSMNITKVFVESGNMQYKDAKKKSPQGRLQVTMLYHELNDEEYVVSESLKEAETKLEHKVKFVEINDTTISGLVNPKNINKKNSKESDKKKNGIDWKFWLGLVVQIVLTGISSGFFFGSNEVQQNRALYITLAVLFGTAFLGLLITTVAKFVSFIKTRNQKSSSLTVNLSEIIEWNANQFIYNSQDVVYVVRVPFFTDSLYWRVFKKYIGFMPDNTVFTCIILKHGNNRTMQHAARYFKDTFGEDKNNISALNSSVKLYVYGYYLKPLSSVEKKLLVEQLGLNRVISRSYMFYGRDYIYRFGSCSDLYYIQSTYDQYILDIYDSFFKESPLEREDIKYLTAFLSCFDRICAGSFRNIMHSNFMETAFNEELLGALSKAVLQSDDETNKIIIKDALSKLWLTFHNLLPFIADRNYSLLSYDGDLSENLQLEPYKFAIDCYFTCLDWYNLQKQSEYYYKNSFEINLIVDKLIMWNEIHETYFADFYVGFLRKVIKYNTTCGLYNSNSVLLDTIQKLFKETRGTNFQTIYDEFFLSREIKTAFMQDAIILPISANSDNGNNIVNVSNYCRERHKTYLKRRTDLMNLTLEVKKDVPGFFELFGTSEGVEEYYSLLLLHEEKCLIDFFGILYRICDSILKKNYFSLTILYVDGETDENLIKDDKYWAIIVYSYIRAVVNKLRAILNVDNCNSIIKNALIGKSSAEELLSCGLLNSELFYLINDLYLVNENQVATKIDGYYLGEYINSKSYKLIDNLVFIEEIKRDRFNNVFSELVSCAEKSGKLNLFLKYFLVILNNGDISPNNHNIMKQYLLQNVDWQLKLIDSEKLKESKAVSSLISVLFAVKENFELEQFKRICCFIQNICDSDWLGDELKDFIKYVINEEEPSFENEENERAFLKKLNNYSANACYLIFIKIMCKKENILKNVFLVKEKLLKAEYVGKLIPFINSLKFFGGEQRTSILKIIVEHIDFKIYNRFIFLEYIRLIRTNEVEIDAFKGDGYSKELMERLFSRIREIDMRRVADMYYHLTLDSGYVFMYANGLFEMMKVFIDSAPLVENIPFDMNEIYSNFTEINVLIEKAGQKFLCQEYEKFVNGVVNGGFRKQIDGKIKIKIMGDLLQILNDETIRLSIERDTRVLHSKLLSAIIERFIYG